MAATWAQEREAAAAVWGEAKAAGRGDEVMAGAGWGEAKAAGERAAAKAAGERAEVKAAGMKAAGVAGWAGVLAEAGMRVPWCSARLQPCTGMWEMRMRG